MAIALPDGDFQAELDPELEKLFQELDLNKDGKVTRAAGRALS